MEPMKPMEPMQPMQPMSAGRKWWPTDYGQPSSSGSQNGMHYAFFPDKRRLLIEQDGKLAIYDSADHQITGVSQRDSGAQTLTFTSQSGPVDLDTLTRAE